MRRRAFSLSSRDRLIILALFVLPLSIDNSAVERPPGLYARYVQSDNVEVPPDYACEHYAGALFIPSNPPYDFAPLGDWSAVGEALALDSAVNCYPEWMNTLIGAIRGIPPAESFFGLSCSCADEAGNLRLT